MCECGTQTSTPKSVLGTADAALQQRLFFCSVAFKIISTPSTSQFLEVLLTLYYRFCRLLSLIRISFVPLGIKIISTEISGVTVQRQSSFRLWMCLTVTVVSYRALHHFHSSGLKNGLQVYLWYTGKTSWRADLTRAQGGSENCTGGRSLIIQCHRKLLRALLCSRTAAVPRCFHPASALGTEFCRRHFTFSFIL